MNPSQMPSVELIQGPTSPPSVPTRGGWRRWKVFFPVLIVTALVGLAIVYGREPVYRASASILTVKPKAVDTRSADADIEHVAIQGRLLLGEDLLGRLARTLETDPSGTLLGIDALQTMLDVVPVPETNLLELRAEGNDPALLQTLVNRWADTYEVFRAEEIEAATGRTTAEIEDEQVRLGARIETAREALQAFRETNEIVGLERGENKAMASLRGLNDALNKARESLVSAEARKAAVEAAVARGETVVPDQQKQQVAELRLNVQRLEGHIADLRRKYTQAYIDRDPNLKLLPEQLRSLRRDLQSLLDVAKITVVDEATQAVNAAAATLAATERQLQQQQTDVQVFNERYREFQALEEDLARLEKLSADNQQRLAQIQVKNLKDFPPIQIVDRARLPTRPIHPDYERDLMIALGIALALALFATWLAEYLSEKPRPSAAAPYVGVKIVTGDPNRALGRPDVIDNRLTAASTNGALAAPAQPRNRALPALPRELGGGEVQALIGIGDPQVNAYACLLLSGVSPYELPLVHRDLFAPGGQRLNVPGASTRTIELAPDSWRHLAAVFGNGDSASMTLPVAVLDQRLRDAARNAGLADSNSVSALSLWHTYVVYLVRQGIDDDALHDQVGMIPPDILHALRQFSPPGGRRPAAQIDFTYPALVD
ncbi:MAG: hypothetical protein KDI82_00970 [Gammaproteobacteria bacterium]|nr:hypothetical protein [Gammaproteobacteria bacterium]